MRISEPVKSKREEILRIALRHGAKNVRIFGSFARGEAKEGSDLDLLIDVSPEHSPFFPGGLIADLEDLLHRKVDVVTEKALHWYIRDQIVKEAIPL